MAADGGKRNKTSTHTLKKKTSSKKKPGAKDTYGKLYQALEGAH